MRLSIVFVAVFFALPSVAEDSRAIKKQLIRDLLETIDSRALTQSILNSVLSRGDQPADDVIHLTEDQRKEYEEILRRQAEQRRIVRDRIFARIDYATYDEEVYGPIFDRAFSASELTDLIAFYKTPTGRKSVAVLPLLAATILDGSRMLFDLTAEIETELEKEDTAAHPWKRTMADIRSVATATEAYATDQNVYPKVSSYHDLEKVLSPIYIREVPDRDVWGTPFSYVVSVDGTSYRFASAGADKRFEWRSLQTEVLPEDFEGKEMDDLDADIIFQDGVFVQFPAGARYE